MVTAHWVGTGGRCFASKWPGANGAGIQRGAGADQRHSNGFGTGITWQVLGLREKKCRNGIDEPYNIVTAVVRAENLAKQADVIAALTLDVLKGTTRAFDASQCGCAAFQQKNFFSI